jgi:hypothetical protein
LWILHPFDKTVYRTPRAALELLPNPKRLLLAEVAGYTERGQRKTRGQEAVKKSGEGDPIKLLRK